MNVGELKSSSESENQGYIIILGRRKCSGAINSRERMRGDSTSQRCVVVDIEFKEVKKRVCDG